MLWYPASRTILSRDDVFPPEERYNWRKYDLVCPTNKWRMRYYECAPIHSHYGRLKKVKYPNIATVELWKYQQKRCYLWRFYSGIFSMTAGFVLCTLVYKTKTEEIYKINNIGSDYPHYITNKFIWYYNYYRVYCIPYMKFHIQTFSYALNYTDHLSENPSNPAFFQIMKYKKWVRNDRYFRVRDSSFDFMDIGENIIGLVDDGI